MSPKTYIDTLFVVALVNQRDQYHDQAAELAAAFEGRRFVTTEAVLLEIGNALARKFRRQAVQIIEHFLSSPDVEVIRLTPELFEESLALYNSHEDKEWGLIDCISFIVMRRESIRDALTLDQHFLQAGFHVLIQRDE